VDLANDHTKFLNSQENFDVTHSWWHSRESSYKDEGDNSDSNVEGRGLEEILHWPPEVLYQCSDHVLGGKRKTGKRRAVDLVSRQA
jgi:hypothetical protein